MWKRFFFSLFILIFIFFTFYIFSIAQEVKIETKKIDYSLPYPGILPDHPLYSFKAGRDRIMDFFTRDNLKKAQLYLLLSDKRTSMAVELSKRGSWKLAGTTISKGEKYFIKIPDFIANLAKQGGSIPKDFITQAKQANDKHAQVIEDLLKSAPAAEKGTFSAVLQLNKQIKQKLSSLK